MYFRIDAFIVAQPEIYEKSVPSVEVLFDRTDKPIEKGVLHVIDNKTYVVIRLGFKIARKIVGHIAELFYRFVYDLPLLVAHCLRIVESARNCGNGYFGIIGYIFYCYVCHALPYLIFDRIVCRY